MVGNYVNWVNVNVVGTARYQSCDKINQGAQEPRWCRCSWYDILSDWIFGYAGWVGAGR